MNMTKVRLIGLSTVDFPVVDASPSDKYDLKEADGLGPPEVDVSITRTRNAGGVYQGRQPQSRQIVLRVGLNPAYSAEETAASLRTTIYGLLTPGPDDIVRVEIWDEEKPWAVAQGYVSKLEPAIFSEDPEVQITIECLHSYLQGPSVIFLSPGSLLTPEIVNDGTAPTGFHMEVVFTQPVSSWSIRDVRGRIMDFRYNFLVGDKLSFNTSLGSRYVRLTRDLGVTNIVHALTSDSVWHSLHGGKNQFVTNHQSFTWGDVYYLPQYWGV